MGMAIIQVPERNSDKGLSRGGGVVGAGSGGSGRDRDRGGGMLSPRVGSTDDGQPLHMYAQTTYVGALYLHRSVLIAWGGKNPER